MKHIHIVGTGPRTGTTLLAEALIACFDIDEHTDHEDRVFSRPPGPTHIYLTKAVKDILVIGPYLKFNPDLFAICMMRDPRDMIVSKHGKDPDRYWAGLRYWHTYVAAWRKIESHPRLITVRYEDLVTDPDGLQHMLTERMPFLTQTAPFSRYHEKASPSPKSVTALRAVRPISPQGIGAWRNHKGRVAAQLEIHPPITTDLIEFGYEADESWLDELASVVPDRSPSHWPERFSRAELLRRTLPAYVRLAFTRVQHALGTRR